MKYKVLRYEERFMSHLVKEIDGNKSFLVDLIVNGDLDENITPKDLIGKEVELSGFHGRLFIGEGVKIIKS